MVTMLEPQQISEQSVGEWFDFLRRIWKQGQHMLLCGPTGTGKTTVASDILDIRDWVCVLAVKKRDETLEQFKRQGYQVIKKWPPEYYQQRVIYWEKPQSLSDDLRKQAVALHNALNEIYLAGGWCVYFDEAGYIAGQLGLGRDLGVLLNQGRSNYLSVVATVTRPSSVIARIPRETLNQPRHKIIFKYTEETDIKACADIAGINWKIMKTYMDALRVYGKGHTDFLYIGQEIIIVRNGG